ncbi:MAG: hypothetical protein ABII27_06530 [bacterium]
MSTKSGEDYQDISDQGVVRYYLNNSRVFDLAKQLGYKLIIFANQFGWMSNNPNADYIVKHFYISELFSVMMHKTLLIDIKFIRNKVTQDIRHITFSTFNKLKIIKEKFNSPIFVHAHIYAPHEPFLFTRNGSAFTEHLIDYGKLYRVTDEKYYNWYINQIIFTNSKLIEVINEILKDKEKLPVIILQGDHGIHYIDWSKKSNYKQERFEVFAAYYLPHGGNKLINEDMQPSNIFRVVFNYYFDYDFEMIQDTKFPRNPVYMETTDKWKENIRKKHLLLPLD